MHFGDPAWLSCLHSPKIGPDYITEFYIVSDFDRWFEIKPFILQSILYIIDTNSRFRSNDQNSVLRDTFTVSGANFTKKHLTYIEWRCVI